MFVGIPGPKAFEDFRIRKFCVGHLASPSHAPGNTGSTRFHSQVIHRFAERLAHLSPGFVGADIANVCNEGALVTAREKLDAVGLDHLEKVCGRVRPKRFL